MRPARLTITGVTQSPVYAPDVYISPFNLALSVVVTGTINYTVQYTFDDVFAPTYNPASGVWTNHPTLAAQAASLDSNIAYPVTGIRIVGNSGTGSARLTLIQAGISGA